jgi:outer membrane protein TolC
MKRAVETRIRPLLMTASSACVSLQQAAMTRGAEAFDLKAPGRNLFSNSDSAANRTYTFRLDQVFERGNKRSLRTEAAKFQVQAAEAQVLDTIRTQLLQLRQAFYTAVLASENVRVANENLDLTNDTERLIKTRVSAGDTPEWDLIKFQASKVQFQRDLAAAQPGLPAGRTRCADVYGGGIPYRKQRHACYWRSTHVNLSARCTTRCHW